MFVTGEFLYSQYRNKEEISGGAEDLFFLDEFSLKACSLEPYLTVGGKQQGWVLTWVGWRKSWRGCGGLGGEGKGGNEVGVGGEGHARFEVGVGEES